MTLRVGQRLGHYEVTGILGAGGMGEVYRARDLVLRREVAIKILPSHVAGNEQALGRFEKEAVVLAQLSHPNILAIHDFGTYEGVTLSVMELLEGESLRSRLERGSIPARQALGIVAAVAEGLAAAHSKSVIHRDLKPENIFLTADGQVKILDFGLARMDWSQVDSDTAFTFPLETDPRGLRGTVGYMAPEQLRGKAADARTDIFSLGCVLYEVLTDRRAFARPTVAETMSAILHEDPPQLLDSGRHLPAEAEQVANHCLEKDPARRYQSARDLALHLKTITSSFDVPRLDLPGRIRSRRWLAWLSGVVIMGLVCLSGFLLWKMESAVALDGGPPSVAVLTFENHTGDGSFDWLRAALPNMLITDLSQSPQIEVLSSDRLYQLLQDMGKEQEETVSFEVIRELAKRAHVNTVVLGSVLKAGDVFRLDTRLQDAVSGRILATERVEGTGETSLFEMIDETTRRIKATLEVTASPESSPDRGIEEVTTSSVLAYRRYVEGNRLHLQGKESEAVPLLEEALKEDPGFAMAAAKLSVLHYNLGHPRESFEFAQRAIELADRLPAQERFYVEGRFYSLRVETLGKAIDAYQRAINLYPTHTAVRHNLANLYFEMEQYEEAAAHYRELIQRGSEFAGTFANLALCLSALGRADEGLDQLHAFLEEHPDHGGAWAFLGDFQLQLGHLEAATEALQKAELLIPGTLSVQQSWFRLYVVESRWDQVERLISLLRANSDPHWQFEAASQASLLALYRGNLEEALQQAEVATRIFEPQGPLTARARLMEATIQLQTDNIQEAARRSEQAYASAAGYPEGDGALFTLALAKASQGLAVESQQLKEKLLSTLKGLPSHMIEREGSLLDGRIALIQQDWRRAIAHFEQAERRFPSRALVAGDRIALWYGLGVACYESGDDAAAADWFEKVVTAGAARVDQPLFFVRSYYYRGKAQQRLGREGPARDDLQAFLGYWREAQFDRPLVRDALAVSG